MEFITAGDGIAHVSSADDGAVYAGIVGTGRYVCGTGDRLSCTMQNANKAVVGTGSGFLDGRAFRNQAPEEVTIQSGTQNQRRNDILCVRFETDSEGREGGGFFVVKGAPTTGTKAKDPDIPSGNILEGATEAYMPLYRIPLDGINVGTPEPMFDVLLPMSELRDSISQSIDVNVFTNEIINGVTSAARSVELDLPEGFEPAAVWLKQAWDWDIVLYSLSLFDGALHVLAHNPSDVAKHLDCLIEVSLRPIREKSGAFAARQSRVEDEER